MRRDAGQLAANHANELAAERQLLVNAEQLLDREHVGNVIGERRQIIEAIRVRDELGISHVLGDFLIAPMEIAHFRRGPRDDFAIQFENDAQHPVRGRV